MRAILLSVLIAGLAGYASAAAAQTQAVSAELLKLHDDLHLSPAQESAWKAYTIAIAPDPQIAERHRAAQALMPQIQTPRRIALIEATMAADARDFHRQGQAVTAFYDQLTPPQQRTFDLDTLPKPGDASALPGDLARPVR